MKYINKRMSGTARLLCASLAAIALSACGGDYVPPSTSQNHSVTASVSGLDAAGLVLSINDSQVTVGNGSTTVSLSSLSAGTAYSITVATQPSGETCSIVNGAGTIGAADVANVVVTCATQTFTLSGGISNLTGAGLVLANGSDRLSVNAASTTFTMPTSVAAGSSYAVTVATQPAGQACSVSQGANTMPANNVTSIGVSCSSQPFTLGGGVTGLTSSGLVIVNGGDSLAVAASASSFMMPTSVAFNASYALSVQTQPTGETCSFSSGGNVAASSGTMPPNNVTNVALVCSPLSFALGGNVFGLSSGTVVLNNGSDTLSVSSNGSFTMPTAVAYGSNYVLSVQTQPTGLTCTPSSNNGPMPAANVTNVVVACAVNTYTVGGAVTNVTGTGLQLQNNGGDTTNIAANATQFSMNTAVAYGSSYNITILSQPAGQACSVSNGSGPVGASSIASIAIVCPQTTTFTTPGTATYTTPAGVTSITIVATGGGGSSGDFPNRPGELGGNGGIVTATIAVNPGDVLSLEVGGGGAANGGSNYSGGAGGGSSNVALNSTTIIVAGGGGGGGGGPAYGGNGGNGAGGGATGADGTDGSASGSDPFGSGSPVNGGTAGAAGIGGLPGGGATAGGSGAGGSGGVGHEAGGVGSGAGAGGSGSPGADGYINGGGGGGGYGGGGGGAGDPNRSGPGDGSGGGGGGGGSLGPAGSTFAVTTNGAAASGQSGGDGSIVISF